MTKFGTNTSGAVWWPNLQLMQVALSGGQIWKLLLAERFTQVADSIPGSVVPLAMFGCRICPCKRDEKYQVCGGDADWTALASGVSVSIVCRIPLFHCCSPPILANTLMIWSPLWVLRLNSRHFQSILNSDPKSSLACAFFFSLTSTSILVV